MSSHAEQEKKSIFKKWWFWVIVVVVLLVIIGSQGGTTNNVTTNGSIGDASNAVTESNTTTEPNTSQRVDEIAKNAKENAKNMNDNLKEEAIQYIKDNKDDFYKDNETMEKAMYYGYLLEYAYEDSNKNLANLGQDVYQAIKYVYRGAEKIDDTATQENLRQIEKDLDNIE